MSAAIPLLAYQKRYIEDQNRFRFWAASVQVGKSFTVALKHFLKRVEKPGLSILLSASDRQSKELMEKVKLHARGAAVVEAGFFGDSSVVQHTAAFPNGSRIIALPANPDTARGFSGDVVLDEFALHRDSRKIWAAMFGRATRGFDIDVLSSFQGTDNKFFELAKTLGLHEGARPEAQPVTAGPWTGHWTDIYGAREDGVKVDIEQLREALADEEVFLQEYCCIPMSGAGEFIPLEMVLACESSEASLDFTGTAGDELYAGMDIGRRKDLTVIAILARLEERLIVRGLITLERQPFAEQLKVARSVAAVVGRMSIDATGIGAMLAETLHTEYPWVEQVQFTAPIKERMASEVKKRLEERTLLLPESAKLRRAICAVKRFVGSTGVIRFDANRTDQGHADEFWALALANAAASDKHYVPASEGGLGEETVVGNLMEAVF
jgi:phage FluMu gp28-like protein